MPLPQRRGALRVAYGRGDAPRAHRSTIVRERHGRTRRLGGGGRRPEPPRLRRDRGLQDDDLAAYLQQLNARSEAQFRKSLRLALAPQQLLAGGAAYEYAFIADPDGVLLELIRRRNALGVGPEVEDCSDNGCPVVLLQDPETFLFARRPEPGERWTRARARQIGHLCTGLPTHARAVPRDVAILPRTTKPTGGGHQLSRASL